MLKLIAPLALALGLASACTHDDDVQARVGELDNLAGLKVTISGVDLAQDRVHAIAKHLEGKAVDTGAAMVRLKKDDGGGPSSLEIEIFAKTLPAADGLAADLKAAFPELAAATITAAPAQGNPQQLPIVEVSHELSPDEAKQEILEQLQAQGVDGQIDVKVQDGAEGRRVEVKVEKELVEQP